MLIIKCNLTLHAEGLAVLQNSLRRQAATGDLILPSFCEILAEVPDGEEIRLAAEIPTAEWRGERGDYTCSNCGAEAPNDGYNPARYCYNCGRRMKRTGE